MEQALPNKNMRDRKTQRSLKGKVFSHQLLVSIVRLA